MTGFFDRSFNVINFVKDTNLFYKLEDPGSKKLRFYDQK